jgi:hypothetical protein
VLNVFTTLDGTMTVVDSRLPTDIAQRIRKAKARVNDDPVKWLVVLLKTPPENLMPHLVRPFSKLQCELAAFANLEGNDPTLLPGQDEVLSTIARVDAGLRNALRRGVWEMSGAVTRRVEIEHSRRTGKWKRAGFRSSFFGGQFSTAFLFAAGDLLEAYSHRFGLCARPGCGNVFLKRKGGLYCGTKCSQWVRDQRFKEKNPTKRHEYYKKRISAIKDEAHAKLARPRQQLKRHRDDEWTSEIFAGKGKGKR